MAEKQSTQQILITTGLSALQLFLAAFLQNQTLPQPKTEPKPRPKKKIKSSSSPDKVLRGNK